MTASDFFKETWASGRQDVAKKAGDVPGSC